MHTTINKYIHTYIHNYTYKERLVHSLSALLGLHLVSQHCWNGKLIVGTKLLLQCWADPTVQHYAGTYIDLDIYTEIHSEHNVGNT